MKLQQLLQQLVAKLQEARAPPQQCMSCDSGRRAVVKCSTCNLAGRWLCAVCDQRLHDEAHCHQREVFQGSIGQDLLPSQHVQERQDGTLHIAGMLMHCRSCFSTDAVVRYMQHARMLSAAADVLLGIRSEPARCDDCGGHEWELLEATSQSARLIAITSAGGVAAMA